MDPQPHMERVVAALLCHAGGSQIDRDDDRLLAIYVDVPSFVISVIDGLLAETRLDPVRVVQNGEFCEDRLEDFWRHFKLAVIVLVATRASVVLRAPWVTHNDATSIMVYSEHAVGMT